MERAGMIKIMMFPDCEKTIDYIRSLLQTAPNGSKWVVEVNEPLRDIKTKDPIITIRKKSDDEEKAT